MRRSSSVLFALASECPRGEGCEGKTSVDAVRVVKDNQEEGMGGVRWSAWDRRGWGDGEGVAGAALEALLDGAGKGDDNFGWAAGVVGFKFNVAIEQHCSVAISDQRVIRTTRCGERRL